MEKIAFLGFNKNFKLLYIKLGFILSILFFSNVLNAQTCTSCASCTFTIDTVYNGNLVITNTDNLCITADGVVNGNITLANANKLCNSGTINGDVTVGGSSELCNDGVIISTNFTVGNNNIVNNYGRLTISNDLTITGSTIFNSLCDFTLGGNLTIDGGSNYTFNGYVAIGGDLIISNSSVIDLTGLILVTGDLSMEGTSQLNLSDSSYVEIDNLILFKNSASINGGNSFYSQIVINGTTTHSNAASYADGVGGGPYLDVCLTLSPGSAPTAPGTRIGSDVTYCVNTIPQIAPTNLCSPLVLCTKGTVSAGSNDTICQGSNYTIPSASTANDSIKGWTTSGDGTFNDTSLIAPIYTPGASDISTGSVILKLTIIDTCGNTYADSLTLIINGTPTTANAGPNDTICNTTTYTLAGNTPTAGTGTWTTITGGGTVTTPSDPTSGVTGLSVGDNEFVWTITSNPCVSSADTVNIFLLNNPTTADAGPNDTICENTTYNLAGNTPTVGTGAWTVFSGGANVTTPSNPTSGVTGLSYGVNTFVWTVSNGVCSSSTDTLIVVRSQTPSIANAGPNDTLCSVTFSTLAGNTPTAGIGTWTTISGGGTVTSPNDPNSGVTGLSIGTNEFQWTISDPNGACPSSSDNMIIIVTATADPADAGPNDTLCNTTTITLAGNTPSSGTATGLWTVTAGSSNVTTPNDPTSGVTGLSPGVNTFTWTISDPFGACPSSASSVTIVNSPTPTVAGAGPNDTLCNTTTTTLVGNTPSPGNGVWTVTVGSANVTTPSNPTSGVTGLSSGVNTFTWTITDPYGVCPSSNDDVTIVNSPTPTVANAGPNDTLCNTTTTTLAGNTPSPGNGTWTVIVGSGNVTTPTNPTSGVTGLSAGVNTFVWTITDPNNACPATTDTVIVVNSPTPTIADAGSNDTLCFTFTTSLAGNTPVPGNGIWTVIVGSGNVTTPTNPISGVSLSSGVNTFVWTISDPNNVCPTTTDTVTIVNSPTPTIANAGVNDTICNTSTYNLSGNSPFPGDGNWTVIVGSSNVTTPSNPSSGVTGLSSGVNTFVWTISDPNNACPTTTDTVIIVSSPTPTVADAGPNDSLCSTTTYTLAGNTPAPGDGMWSTFAGGATVTTPTNPTSGVTGLAAGNNIFVWTITDPFNTCPTTTDTVIITNNQTPIINNPGNMTTCDSVQLPAITGTNLTGGEAYFTGTNGTGISYAPGDWITSSISPMYIYDETGTNPNCFDEISFGITINPTPVINNPGNITACDSVQLPAITGTNLTGGEAYYLGTNGTGISYAPGDWITSSISPLYLFDETSTFPNCLDEVSFNITINSTPVINNPGDMTACDSVQLPAITGTNLTGNEAYFTGTNGTGTSYNAGDWITASVTPMYIYDETGTTPNCFDEVSFNITINSTPIINNPGDMIACDSVQLPAITGTNLTGNEAYFTGTNGTGTSYNAGDWITASVTPMYIYDETGTTPNCLNEITFNITINPTPSVAVVTPSECENVPGSGQALNINVTGLESALNGGGTFVWFTNNTYTTPFTPNNETVDNGETFYFEVIVNGCPYRDSVTYSVSNNIVLNDPTPEFCEDVAGGGSVAGVDLTSFNNGVFVGTSSYTWSTGPTGVTINDGDSISVQVQQGSCPVVDIFVHFTVNPLPTAVMATDSLCDDGTGQATFNLAALNNIVNGGTGNAVTWFTDNTLSSPIIPSNAFLSGSTIVYALVTNGTTGCSDTASVNLTVILTPIINNPGNMIACDSIQLPVITGTNLTGNETYYTGTAGTGTVYSAGDFITTNTTLFVYDSTATSPSCFDQESFTITINPTPSVNVVNPSECENVPGSKQALNIDVTALEISLSGSGTFTWFTDRSYGTPFTPTSETVDSGEVFYYEITINGCTLQDSVVYSVGDNITLNDPLPVFCEDIAGGGSVAGIDLTTFNNGVFVGADSYTWTQGPTGVTINDGDSIEVLVQKGSCPVVSTFVNFTVNPLPVINVPSGGNVCVGETINLTPSSGGVWTSSDTTVATIDNNGLVTGITSGTANMIFTDSITGCANSAADGLITVNPLPTVSVPSGGLVCVGETINLTPSSGGIWTSSDTTVATVDNNGVVTGVSTGTANMIFTDIITGCSSLAADGLITVNPLPTITVSSGGILCVGNTINLTPSSGGVWSSSNPAVATIDNNGVVTGVSTGTTNMIFTDAITGCSSIATDGLITVNDITALIDANPITGTIPLDVFFGNQSTTGSGISYTWDFGNGNTSSLFEPNHIFTAIGDFTVTLITSNGTCSDTDQVIITPFGKSDILIPNIFTPNDDGQNDVFTVKGVNLESVEGVIYNRWGQTMFQWNHVKGYWDGTTLAGSEVPDGTYFYVISAKGVDGEEYFKKGSFSLIR
ncbi:MAG: gliding motility-associated C-terminal domain-containing protein [Vicingus serpentipes]|nr:gliding motility-associated C-terminal domain-containing protein [Vicingus serpentipes]